MRTVFFAAASSLFLAFAAHGADAPNGDAARDQAAQQDVSQAVPAVSSPAPACIDNGGLMSHAAYTTDDDADCCNTSAYCSQYLSTQTLVQAPSQGHT